MLRAYGLSPTKPSGPSEAVRLSDDAEADHMTNGAGLNGAAPHAAACRFCHQPDCRLTPGGQFCRLSEEDKRRWAEPVFFFDDGREEIE